MSCPRHARARSCGRLLKDVAENREVGDVTTLADANVMSLIKTGSAQRRRVAADSYGDSEGYWCSRRPIPFTFACSQVYHSGTAVARMQARSR